MTSPFVEPAHPPLGGRERRRTLPRPGPSQEIPFVSIIQTFCVGLMIALAPSLVAFAWAILNSDRISERRQHARARRVADRWPT
jgi:hypothetical protein